MTSSVPAWLIFVGDKSFALAEKEMIEYMTTPSCMTVPVTPAYASRVILWRDRILPVMDLAILNGDSPVDAVNSLVVVAYQKQAGEPLSYVALIISKPPVRIMVEDQQACDEPEDGHGLLTQVSLAYFMQGDEPVSILDLKQLCSVDFLLKATQPN